MAETDTFNTLMASAFPGDEAAIFEVDANQGPESFDGIMRRNLTTGTIIGLSELMDAAEKLLRLLMR